MYNKGITLIELLVTMSIIVLLGTLIYPSFSSLLAEHHRHNAEQTLLIMAKNMEIYKVQNHQSYTGVAFADIKPANLPTDHHYQFSITIVTEQSYQLEAQPEASQAHRDSECGTLTLDQLGERGSHEAKKPNNCWDI
ncbi:MAG: prepilin-type N-terminal cleavage/methylation domain-containing protein [Gammaproteobacteria bacterium]|nr:prepilin-type N-terminal cleavage/methylation domain-containing protein [Gammaproteobacteria bacterium]